jgi:lipopolysaccharide biosynthesis glycosyltransferase
MTSTVKRLSIVVSTDNHYLILLAVLIKSIEENNKTNLPIDLYVISENVTEQNKERLAKSINQLITTIYWFELEDIVQDNYKVPFDWTSFPRNIHARLYVPHFIPLHIENILYLDVDMIVCKDLTELFKINLGNNIVGAVLDQHVHTFSNEWGGIKNYEELGLSPDLNYFNTGLLMINCNAWRTFGVTQKVIKCIEQNKKYANFPDQYGLNVVLADRWKKYDPLWNYFSFGNEKKPYLIHFVKRKPIYKSYNGNMDFKKLFIGYLMKTQWKNEPEISELSRYLKKLSNVFNKVVKALF